MRYNQELAKRARLAIQVNNLVSTLTQPIRVVTLFERFQKELMGIHGLSKDDFNVKRYEGYSLDVKDKIFGPGISLFPQEEDSHLFYLSLGFGGAYRMELGTESTLDGPTIEGILEKGFVRPEVIGVETVHHFGSRCYFFRFNDNANPTYLGLTETDWKMDNWVHRNSKGETIETVPRRIKAGHSPDTWSVVTPENLPMGGLILV